MTWEAISIPIISGLDDFWKKRLEIPSSWTKNNLFSNTELPLDICEIEWDNIDSQKDSGKRTQTISDRYKSMLNEKFNFSTNTCILDREMTFEKVVLEGMPAVFSMCVIADGFLNIRIKIDNHCPRSQEIFKAVCGAKLRLGIPLHLSPPETTMAARRA
jgi:hypothetical protein